MAALREREAQGDLELLGSSIKDPVEVATFDPAWTDRFEAVRSRISEALGPIAIRIDHVGSTSVPGLDAKPIIDVQVSVASLADEPAYSPPLAALGWPLRLREPDHRFFREPAGERRTTHVHVCAGGSSGHGEATQPRSTVVQATAGRRDSYAAAEDGAHVEPIEGFVPSCRDADRSRWTRSTDAGRDRDTEGNVS